VGWLGDAKGGAGRIDIRGRDSRRRITADEPRLVNGKRYLVGGLGAHVELERANRRNRLRGFVASPVARVTLRMPGDSARYPELAPVHQWKLGLSNSDH